MNSIKWLGDETADDLPDRLHTLYKAISDERYAVQETVLVKELYHGLNGHGRAYETTNNSYEYIGQDLASDELTIINLAYLDDARQMLELLRKHYGDIEQ